MSKESLRRVTTLLLTCTFVVLCLLCYLQIQANKQRECYGYIIVGGQIMAPVDLCATSKPATNSKRIQM